MSSIEETKEVLKKTAPIIWTDRSRRIDYES